MQLKKLAAILISSSFLAACGGAGEAPEPVAEVDVANTAPEVSFTPSGSSSGYIGKPGGPVSVAYRIIGQPVVGQPVAIEIRMLSAMGTQPIDVGYRISDATAMQLAESQPSLITVAPTAREERMSHQVTVVPLREGRLYLNVSASVETPEGSMSTVTAIPIQVGEGGRVVEENGTLGSDENGDAIRSVPANPQ